MSLRRVYSGESIPDDIYVSLVKTIFGSLKILIISGLIVVCVAAKVAVDSQSSAIVVVTILLFLSGVARLITMRSFLKNAAAVVTRASARRWEYTWAAFSVSYAAAIGMLVFLTLTEVNQIGDDLLVNAAAFGAASIFAARNAGRPAIAVGQLTSLILPIVAGCLWHATVTYLVLAGLNMVFLVVSTETVRKLNADMVRLLTAQREGAALAASLASKNLLLDTALDNMSHGLCVFDDDHGTVIANRRYQDLLGLPAALVRRGVSIRDIVAFCTSTAPCSAEAREVVAIFEDLLTSGLAGSTNWPLADGRCLCVSHQPMAGGGSVVLFEDVTDRWRAEARIVHMAHHDALTDLPNRVRLSDRLTQDLASFGEDTGIVLLCLDLDRFKAVNDTLGHRAGDVLLCQVADRIRRVIDDNMMAARTGGDEFVIVARQGDERQTALFVERLIAALSAPYEIDGHRAEIGVSIGAARAMHRHVTAEALFAEADKALYRAKNAGRGRAHFALAA